MQYYINLRKMLMMAFVLPIYCACGSQTNPVENSTTSSGGKQLPFVKLTEAQTKDVCQWITPEKITPLFGLEGGSFRAPRSAGGLSFQCDQFGTNNTNGVQVGFHLKPFENEEIYTTSLEAAKVALEHLKYKIIPLGVAAHIYHAAIPGTNQITSVLQVHGSSYALDVTAQYQGQLKEADIEKALVTLARAFVEKYP